MLVFVASASRHSSCTPQQSVVSRQQSVVSCHEHCRQRRLSRGGVMQRRLLRGECRLLTAKCRLLTARCRLFSRALMSTSPRERRSAATSAIIQKDARCSDACWSSLRAVTVHAHLSTGRGLVKEAYPLSAKITKTERGLSISFQYLILCESSLYRHSNTVSVAHTSIGRGNRLKVSSGARVNARISGICELCFAENLNLHCSGFRFRNGE